MKKNDPTRVQRAPLCSRCGQSEAIGRCGCGDVFCDACGNRHEAEEPDHERSIERVLASLVARGLVYVTIDPNGEPRYHVADRRIVL